jgi:protein gp37
MEANWVRRVWLQCHDQGVPFFFKQWGGVFKAKTGRELDGQTYDAYPEVGRKEPQNRRLRLEMIDEIGSE